MIEFVGQVIRGTPLWVWAVLLLLGALGARQLHDREVQPATVLIAPIGFLIFGLLTTRRNGLSLSVWGVALVVGALFTMFVWRPVGQARYDAQTNRLHLPGSVVPICVMLSIFLLSYVIQVALSIEPSRNATLLWQIAPGLTLGLLSGLFLGRAVLLFRLRPEPTRGS